MKYKILHFLFLMLLLIYPLYADIDSKINAIQNAPVEERFRLMNAFKQEMVKMREEERISAMHKIQSITKSKHAKRALKELQDNRRTRYSKDYKQSRDDHEQENEIEEQVQNETEDQIEEEAENQIEDETEDNNEEVCDDD